MENEQLHREEIPQSLNAETSEQSNPQKAIPGTPENIASSEPIARQSNAVIDYDNIPTQFVSSSLKTEDAARPAAPNLETAPVLSEAAPKSVETPATPAPTPAELATTARAEKVATLKNKLENLGRGEEFNFFTRKYTSLLNKPAADADFSDLDNNLQKLSDYLESDQKFEITKVGNLQIRMAGMPILEEYYAAWLQSKSGNAKNEGLAKALDLRRQIAQNHPEVSTQIQAIEYNSGSTEQGKKYAYLRLLAGYAPKTETAENQHLNQHGIDDRLATNDQDTAKAAQQAVQQKSPEKNTPPTTWDKYTKAGSPQKAEQDLEKNIQKLPVKAQNGGGKKTEKSDPKNPQQSQPDPFQALWSVVDALKNTSLSPDGEAIMGGIGALSKAGKDIAKPIAKGVKSLYNTITGKLPAEEYADFIGKGGTIYVHVLDITQGTPMEPENFNFGDKINISQKNWMDMEAVLNEKFKALDINLKVKVVMDLGAKPLSRKQFQNRSEKETKKGFDPEFNVNDSYMIINHATQLQEWAQGLNKKKLEVANPFANKEYQEPTVPYAPTDEWSDSMGASTGVGAGLAAADQFLALGNSASVNYFVKKYLSALPNQNQFNDAATLQKGIATALGGMVEHEVGHNKFAGNSLNDTNDHVPNTIMDAGLKGNHALPENNYGYSPYMRRMLQLMHGTTSGKNLHTQEAFSQAPSDEKEAYGDLYDIYESRSRYYAGYQASEGDLRDYITQNSPYDKK